MSDEGVEAVTELDDALTRLKALSPRQSELLEHRYFGGLSLEETAAAANVSPATVKRELRFDGRDFQIVGVVADVANEPTGATAEMVYLSHTQFADERNWALTYVLKTTGAPDEIASVARRDLAQVDHGLVVYSLGGPLLRMSTRFSAGFATYRGSAAPFRTPSSGYLLVP